MNTFLYIFSQLLDPDSVNIPKIAPAGSDNVVTQLLGILFGILSALSLLIITVAGFRYVISRGDPNTTTQAKDTIMYAMAGLIISMSAFMIVKFVAGQL